MTKKEKELRELNFGINNMDKYSCCKGNHYIWNRGFTEDCKNRSKCAKYLRYLNITKQQEFLYDKPQVQFLFISSFRQCVLFKKNFTEIAFGLPEPGKIVFVKPQYIRAFFDGFRWSNIENRQISEVEGWQFINGFEKTE